MPAVGLSWSRIARTGVTGIPCDLPCSAHLSTRAEGHDVIFLGIFFDEDLDWFIGFKMRYRSTPAAGAFQFPPKSPRNDPSNVIFATFPTILAMFCMPARGPVGVRLGPKSGPAHPQGSPQGPQRVWGDSRKKSFFSIPGYPKPASRTEAIVSCESRMATCRPHFSLSRQGPRPAARLPRSLPSARRQRQLQR